MTSDNILLNRTFDSYKPVIENKFNYIQLKGNQLVITFTNPRGKFS